MRSEFAVKGGDSAVMCGKCAGICSKRAGKVGYCAERCEVNAREMVVTCRGFAGNMRAKRNHGFHGCARIMCHHLLLSLDTKVPGNTKIQRMSLS